MKVYQALAKAFAEEGTTAVFGMMGSANLGWIVELEKLGVTTYEVRHEGAGVSMAEGWGRVTGIPGVCTTTSGASTAQIATTMIVAARTRFPLVAFCGDTSWGANNDQSLDQSRFAAACESGFVQLTSADDAYEVVRTAFFRAKTESRPILLSVPSNLQQQEFDDDEEYITSASMLVGEQIAPNLDRIAQAAEIIAQSERPVIVVGRGAQESQAGEAVVALARRIGGVITTSLMAMNWLKDSDPFQVGVSGLYSSRTAMELFQDADCVIAIGASMNQYTSAHGYLYPEASHIHIDERPRIVMGNGRVADCYIQSDARLGVEALNNALVERAYQCVGFRTSEIEAQLVTALDDPVEFEIDPDTVDPREVVRALDEVFPAHIALSFDSGHQSHLPAMLCKKERQITLVNKGFGGCVGQGLITGIGGVVASNRNPMLVIQGDAGFMMHLGEFETAVRYDLPMFVVVLNNQALGTEVHELRRKGFDPQLGRIHSPDLGAVGVAMGARGHLVRSIDELIAAANQFIANPAPTLVDVRIAENVLSVQRRRVMGDDSV